MDEAELRELVVAKWGRLYDTRIHRRRDGRQQLKFYLQVMWKHADQQSFHLSAAEYMEQLGAVAGLISEWQLGDYVREQIKETKQRPGIGVGRGAVSGAVCVSIPLMWEGLKFTTLALPMFFAPYDEGHAGPRDCSYVTVPVHVVAHCDGRYRWYLVPCP